MSGCSRLSVSIILKFTINIYYTLDKWPKYIRPDAVWPSSMAETRSRSTYNHRRRGGQWGHRPRLPSVCVLVPGQPGHWGQRCREWGQGLGPPQSGSPHVTPLEGCITVSCLVLEKVPSKGSITRRSPLLGPSPGWKRLLPLSHLRHY